MAKAQKEVWIEDWSAFAYVNGTGEAVKVRSKEAYDKLIADGHSDCPTKAKKAKAKAAAK